MQPPNPQESIEPPENMDEKKPDINVPHLKVYFDPEHDVRDGKGFCVDHDLANSPGTVGARFDDENQLADYVIRVLSSSAMKLRIEP